MHRSIPPVLASAALLLAACNTTDTSATGDDGDGRGGRASPTSGGTDPPPHQPADAMSDATTSDITTAVSVDGSVVVTADTVDGNVLARSVTVTAPEAVSVQLTAQATDHTVTTPRTADLGREHRIPLVGLRADRVYDVDATLLDADGAELPTVSLRVTTGALPEFLPDLEIVTASHDAMQPGLTLIELVPADGDAGHVQVIDHDGEVVWYHREASSISAVEQTAAGTFTGVLYPFAYIELDVLGDQLRRWELAGDEATATRLHIDGETGTAVDGALDYRNPHHDVAYLPNGNLLGMAMTSHPTTDELRRRMCPDDDREWTATSDVVIEFEPDGTIVRTWDVWDVLDIETHPGVHLCVDGGVFASATERDWSHGNAAVYDPDRDVVLVSVRHTDHVIAFEYGTAEEYPVGTTAPARWILGPAGTVPIDGDTFSHQHAPEVQSDGSILLYDNGNLRPGEDQPYSRAVLYDVDDTGDPATWRATQRWEHRVDDVDGTPLYAPFLGDADRLGNGNVLITHGGIGQPGEPEQRTRIIEAIPAAPSGGDIVFDVRIGTEDLGFNSYRADRIDSLYVGAQWED